MPHSLTDVLIIGGGAVGLSLAYELAGHDVQVCVIDRREFGREASWAGAGIIPFGSWYTSHPAAESLAALSRQIFPQLIQQLRDESGIDGGWRVCGGIYLSAGLGNTEHQQMINAFGRWQARGARCQPLERAELKELEPGVARSKLLEQPTDPVAWHLPQEAQIRNPRYLKALLIACRRRGVRLVPHAAVYDFKLHGRRIDQVQTEQGVFSAHDVCLTAGCWTGQLASRLGLRCALKPIRGQIALIQQRACHMPVQHVVHQNGLYVVPRNDGLVLVGATVEDAGFSKATTTDGIGRLLAFAGAIGLGTAEVVQCWSGLRPAPADDLPYIGRIPGFKNGWIATGHFRAGLQMSPATAVAVSAIMRRVEPPLDITPFSLQRSRIESNPTNPHRSRAG